MAQQRTPNTTVNSVRQPQAGARPVRPNGGSQHVMKPYTVSVAVPMGGMQYQPRVQQTEPQKAKKGKKRNRRERDYFFVMRKGVCFLMFLVCVAMIAILALSFLKIMPSITAMYVIPDLTTQEERDAYNEEHEEEVDENGYVIEYEDQSQYVGIGDGIYGLLNKLTGGSAEEEEPEAEAADDEAVTPGDAEGEVPEEEAEEPRSPIYDEVSAKLAELTGENAPEIAASDSMLTIANYLFVYGPIAYIVMAVILLLSAIKAFFGMFGKRIFKRFGLAAIILLICAAVILLSGLVIAGVRNGNPSEDEEGNVVSVLDFGGLMDFVTQAFQTYPADAAAMEEGTFLTFKAGYGSLILLILPVALLVLSFFARRKVPYSIFDR